MNALKWNGFVCFCLQIMPADTHLSNFESKPMWKRPPRKSSMPASQFFRDLDSQMMRHTTTRQDQPTGGNRNIPLSASSFDLSCYARKPPIQYTGSYTNGQKSTELNESVFKLSIPNLSACKDQNYSAVSLSSPEFIAMGLVKNE